MEKNVVRPVFLPRHGPREEEIWSTGLEHPIRVQRVWSQDQSEANAGEVEEDLTAILLYFSQTKKKIHHPFKV